MRRLRIGKYTNSIRFALVLLLVTMPWIALAATSGAHFFSATGSVSASGALVVNFDEAGLGNISGEVAYTLTADASATYACINGGSNHPKASNKENLNGPLSADGSFPPTNNGRVIASLSAGPISAGSFSCPSGQRLVLANVAYTNIVLTDTTNNVSITVPNVSRTFFDI